MSLKLKNYSYAALSPDDISHYMKTAGEAGGIVCYVNTNPFGPTMDDPDNVVGYVATPDANTKVAGLLMMTVLDYDPTKVERNNQNPFEVPVNSKVWVRTGGYVDTNMITTADVAGLTGPTDAYLGLNGLLTTSAAAPTIKVGRFESGVDSDGYVKLTIDIA